MLVVAGVLDVAWAIGFKYSDGFRRPVPSDGSYPWR
jgi:multidrug transporter EmrE-like cation transporter